MKQLFSSNFISFQPQVWQTAHLILTNTRQARSLRLSAVQKFWQSSRAFSLFVVLHLLLLIICLVMMNTLMSNCTAFAAWQGPDVLCRENYKKIIIQSKNKIRTEGAVIWAICLLRVTCFCIKFPFCISYLYFKTIQPFFHRLYVMWLSGSNPMLNCVITMEKSDAAPFIHF